MTRIQFIFNLVSYIRDPKTSAKVLTDIDMVGTLLAVQDVEDDDTLVVVGIRDWVLEEVLVETVVYLLIHFVGAFHHLAEDERPVGQAAAWASRLECLVDFGSTLM